jgi:hypothetical protein
MFAVAPAKVVPLSKACQGKSALGDGYAEKTSIQTQLFGRTIIMLGYQKLCPL